MLTVIQGDCRDKLRELADESVHCVVTSPPYFALRDYNADGQVGLEESPEAHVATMIGIFREVKRVLRSDGTLWMNYGDCFRDKQLLGMPWRVAFALQADGWYLRSEIIWHKPNPMPESVTDRPTKAHEQMFLLAKSRSYFYDAEAIREGLSESTVERWGNGGTRFDGHEDYFKDRDGGKKHIGQLGTTGLPPSGARNKRSVWTIATSPYSDAHFATFPPKLVEPCILAGTSARGCCAECGAPWERVVERGELNSNGRDKSTHGSKGNANQDNGWNDNNWKPGHSYELKTTGWQPTCTHLDADVVPAVVLDPFAGSGTVGKVALELGRRAVLIELNPKYCEMIERRNQVTLGLPGLA